MQEEPEEVVRRPLVGSVVLRSTRLVGLVEDYHPEATTKEMLRLRPLLRLPVRVHAMDDEAGGYQADGIWAPGDVLDPSALDHPSCRIDPALPGAVPPGDGHREAVEQLDLPLLEQCGWNEDEDRSVTKEDGDESGSGEGQGLSYADLVGQKHARPTVGLAVTHELDDESTLPWLQRFAIAIDRRLCQGRWGDAFRIVSEGDDLDLASFGEASHLLYDGVR